MSFLRRTRKRRPDDGRFLERDEKAWRRLIRCARQAIADPRPQFAAELGQAARAAVRAVFPPGFGGRTSPFLRLIAKGRVYETTPVCGRAPLASCLGELADICADALDGPRPAPRARADLE